MFLAIIKNKYFWILGLIVILIFGNIYFYKSRVNLRTLLNTTTENLKAYAFELDSVTNQSRVFKLNLDQLKFYNDSILQKLNTVRKELKIKDSKLQTMQYLLTEASKIDTLLIRDTIFRDPNFQLDTIVEHKPHYQLKLSMTYPNEVIINPSFYSETFIFTHQIKETINPPKKFFLWRIFQKKHTVVEVNIVEKNPFIIHKQNKFIEIIK